MGDGQTSTLGQPIAWYEVCPNVKRVAVRKKPSTKSEGVGMKYPGEAIAIYKIESGWAQVSHDVSAPSAASLAKAEDGKSLVWVAIELPNAGKLLQPMPQTAHDLHTRLLTAIRGDKHKEVQIIMKPHQKDAYDPNKADELGETLLFEACAAGAIASAAVLLAAKADPTLRSSSGYSAIDFAEDATLAVLLKACAGQQVLEEQLNNAFEAIPSGIRAPTRQIVADAQAQAMKSQLEAQEAFDIGTPPRSPSSTPRSQIGSSVIGSVAGSRVSRELGPFADAASLGIEALLRAAGLTGPSLDRALEMITDEEIDSIPVLKQSWSAISNRFKVGTRTKIANALDAIENESMSTTPTSKIHGIATPSALGKALAAEFAIDDPIPEEEAKPARKSTFLMSLSPEKQALMQSSWALLPEKFRKQSLAMRQGVTDMVADNDEEKFPLYQVVHSPSVVVREEPAFDALVLGAKWCGEIVEAYEAEAVGPHMWVRVKHYVLEQGIRNGWMALSAPQFGVLMRPAAPGSQPTSI